MGILGARSRRADPHAMRGEPPCRVSIRRIEPSDRDGLSDLYLSLSPESRRSRFLGSVGDEAVRDSANRMSGHPGLVAVLDEPGPRDGALVGHIVLVPAGSDAAELAIVVADAFQGRGIGSRLVCGAGEEARRLGIRRLTASTYADNARMRRLLLHLGWPVERDAIDACVEEIELAVA